MFARIGVILLSLSQLDKVADQACQDRYDLVIPQRPQIMGLVFERQEGQDEDH